MMKWMECRATRREIDQTEVGEQLSAQTLRHVASCAACLAFQNERARLRELLTSLEPVTAPADFDFRLRARIAVQKESVGPRSFFAGFVLSTPAIASAAVVVVLGVSILWIAQHGKNQRATVAANPPGQAEQSAAPVNKSAKVGAETNVLVAAEKAPTLGTTTSGPGKLIPADRGRNSSTARSPHPGMSTRDFNVGPAPTIKQGQNPSDVSVSAPLKPMVLSFQDDNGATRTFSLPPVSFGSQRLLESRVVPVSLKNARVW